MLTSRLAIALLVAACTEPRIGSLREAPYDLSRPTRIPLALDDRPVVDVRIGSAGPQRFLVDTGSDLTLVTAASVRELGLSKGTFADPIRVHGSTDDGRDIAEFARVDRLALGDLVVGSCAVAIVDDPALAAANVVGILGQDLLARFTVAIDLQQRALHVVPATGREAVTAWLNEACIGVGAWVTVELAPRAEGESAIPILPLRLEGRDQPLPLFVDTGAAGTSLPREALATLQSEPIGTRLQEGIGGAREDELHRLEGLDLFGLKLSLDVVAVPGDRGLLGMDVWSQLVLVVDGPARMLWLHHRP